MKTNSTTGLNVWLPVLLTLCALSAAPRAQAGEDIDRTLEMPADGVVSVENVAGTVEFVSWERAEVQIRGEAGDSVEDIMVESTASGVEVRVVNRKSASHVDSTDLHFRIPREASVEAETVSADISVGGTRGESIVLRSVSGDIEVDAEPRRMELSSVSGDVKVEGAVSRSSVETVSGEIVIVGANGEIGANTVSGDVSLDAGEVTRGRFEAVSGELILSLSLADGGRLTCDSMSGDVNLKLPSTQEAEFTAQTFSGDINTDFGQSARVSKGPGVMLEHRQGENGAKIRLESFSGDISIRSR